MKSTVVLWLALLSPLALPRPNLAVQGGFLFPVPASGTAAPILIQSSTNLGNWFPAGGLLPAANPGTARTASPVTIFPAARRGASSGCK